MIAASTVAPAWTSAAVPLRMDSAERFGAAATECWAAACSRGPTCMRAAAAAAFLTPVPVQDEGEEPGTAYLVGQVLPCPALPALG